MVNFGCPLVYFDSMQKKLSCQRSDVSSSLHQHQPSFPFYVQKFKPSGWFRCWLPYRVSGELLTTTIISDVDIAVRYLTIIINHKS